MSERDAYQEHMEFRAGCMDDEIYGDWPEEGDKEEDLAAIRKAAKAGTGLLRALRREGVLA